MWCVFACSDLESVIEEIRKDVVGRRCRVNITEVEKLALALSQLSRSLASLKGLSVYIHYYIMYHVIFVVVVVFGVGILVVIRFCNT